MDQFVTRLKQKVQPCNFVDIDHEIKDQIVFNSDCVQRKALRNNLALQNLVAVARVMELSNKQAVLIEEKNQELLYHIQKPAKYSSKYDKDRLNKRGTNNNRKCIVCGNSWPHKNLCPALGHHCKSCSEQNHFKSKCKPELS